MQFELTQQFAAAPAEVLAVYTDAAFYADLPEFNRVGRPELIERRVEPQRVTMRVRYRFTADLPAGADRVIDKQKLTWIEETVYDLDRVTSASRLLPDHYPDRLKASARARYTPTGGGTVRHIVGSLEVRMRLVGGRVERAIVDGLEEHLTDEAALVNARLLA